MTTSEIHDVPLPGMPEPGPAPALWAVRYGSGETLPMPDEASARVTAAVCVDLDRDRWQAGKEAVHQAQAVLWPGTAADHAAAMAELERES